MARTKISEYSTTAGNNTDINSINLAEGCAPSGINDAIRELMRQLKEFQTGGAGDSVNSGGDFSVATNKFTVASASGNTSVAGTLGVTGAATLSSTLAVTGTTTLTGALVANGNATLGDASGDTVTIKGTPTLEVNPTLSGGTANGVLYLNGSKVATSGSALTFDGTTFTSNTSVTKLRTSTNVNAQFSSNPFDANGVYLLGVNDAGNSFIPVWTSGSYIGYAVGGSEAMRLTSTGLGVGTSSPSYKLDVAGSVARIKSSSAYSGLGLWSDDANASTRNWLVASSYNNYGDLCFVQSTTQGGNPVGGTVRATLDSSGNLGLGVTPSAWATVTPAIELKNGVHFAAINTGTPLAYLGANCYYDGSNWIYKVSANYAARYELNAGGVGAHGWFTTSSGTAGATATFTQSMTLDASGNLLVGKTSSSGGTAGIELAPAGQIIATRSGGASGYFNRLTSDGSIISFNRTNAEVGTISVTTTATAYNTSSDYRLKNITGPITNSGAYIDSLNPVEGTWKADGSTFVGLIAHEVQEASRTNVATGVKDGEQMQGMDYSSAEIIANLIAEVKSLRARVAALES